jgi:deoxyribonuclease-4
MPLFGAHMSIAGGYYKAADAAAELGMDTVQIFTKNNNQWQGKPLSEPEIAAFREAIARHGLKSPCAHDSYLINLASPNDELWKKSLDAFVIELERAEALGLAGVVMHPGSFVSSSEQEGLDKIVIALKQSLDRVERVSPDLARNDRGAGKQSRSPIRAQSVPSRKRREGKTNRCLRRQLPHLCGGVSGRNTGRIRGDIRGV